MIHPVAILVPFLTLEVRFLASSFSREVGRERMPSAHPWSDGRQTDCALNLTPFMYYGRKLGLKLRRRGCWVRDQRPSYM